MQAILGQSNMKTDLPLLIHFLFLAIVHHYHQEQKPPIWMCNSKK